MDYPELILSPRNDGGWNQLQVLPPRDNGQQLVWQAELTERLKGVRFCDNEAAEPRGLSPIYPVTAMAIQWRGVMT